MGKSDSRESDKTGTSNVAAKKNEGKGGSNKAAGTKKKEKVVDATNPAKDVVKEITEAVAKELSDVIKEKQPPKPIKKIQELLERESMNLKYTIELPYRKTKVIGYSHNWYVPADGKTNHLDGHFEVEDQITNEEIDQFILNAKRENNGMLPAYEMNPDQKEKFNLYRIVIWNRLLNMVKYQLSG